MRVYIDESGDCWFKFWKWSSDFFTIALVIFHSNEDANDCEDRIRLLKKELGYPENQEFHYVNNSNRIREYFFKWVNSQNFFYYAFVLDKTKLWSESFKSKKSFYKYVAWWLLENAKEHLEEANVFIDGSGDTGFRKELSAYLKNKFNYGEKKRVSSVKMIDSCKMNNLQLVDYVASATNRMYTKKDWITNPIQFISDRCMNVQLWPK